MVEMGAETQDPLHEIALQTERAYAKSAWDQAAHASYLLNKFHGGG